MIKFSIQLIFILMLTSCAYGSKNSLEIESDLYSITQIGISSEQAKKLIEKKFGKKSFSGQGPASQVEGVWKREAWSKRKIENGPYFFTYELSWYPSEYIVLPTIVYGTWYFSENNELLNVIVHKEIDAL